MSTLQIDFEPAGLNLEDYWNLINWKELSEEEFRFLLVVISIRGKKVLESLEKSSDIALAIDRLKSVRGLEKSEKVGLRWLSEIDQ